MHTHTETQPVAGKGVRSLLLTSTLIKSPLPHYEILLGRQDARTHRSRSSPLTLQGNRLKFQNFNKIK